MAKANATIREVGSVELERIHGVSNLNAVSDGLRVLRTIMSERRRTRVRAMTPAPAVSTIPSAREAEAESVSA